MIETGRWVSIIAIFLICKWILLLSCLNIYWILWDQIFLSPDFLLPAIFSLRWIYRFSPTVSLNSRKSSFCEDKSCFYSSFFFLDSSLKSTTVLYVVIVLFNLQRLLYPKKQDMKQIMEGKIIVVRSFPRLGLSPPPN